MIAGIRSRAQPRDSTRISSRPAAPPPSVAAVQGPRHVQVVQQGRGDLLLRGLRDPGREAAA